ncbi:hypothetical protein LZ575_11045 [Antarcticibacterium sp. 1MA-6-2]|uniref:hypothetical protein n=1 Tax=Antarcticibacterium sp. 1MA-6-2 TaxID=2908210 RepID=UPI001F427CB4|nr:hypothetical protein [Antarcticibacterium sp. 1MA-6-2]UJH92891.1 hypothetical protein LZ575_11045 [Antarcticibacterium sp. 1MA-6-2]
MRQLHNESKELDSLREKILRNPLYFFITISAIMIIALIVWAEISFGLFSTFLIK